MSLRDRILFLLQADGEGGGGGAGGAGGEGGAGGAAAGGGEAGAAAAAAAVQALRDLLPEDMRADKRFEKFKDVGALAKSFAELDALRGKSVVIPGEKATPEELAKFYDRLGRPKDAKGYKLDLGEGFEVKDEGLLGQYLEVFHRVGLTPAQANEIAKFEAGRVKGAFEAHNTKVAEGWKALDTEWGDKKAANIEVAKRAATQLGLTKDDIDALGQQMGSQAAVVRALHKIGAGLGEDTAVGRKPRDAGGDGDAASVQKKIDELQAGDKYRAGDRATHDEVRRLYQILYPSQAAAA